MPGSWELYKASVNRVLIGVLTPPDMRLTMRWMDNATQIQQRAPLGSGLSRMSGLPFGHARNVILKQALDNGFGWVFYLDADTLPPVSVIPDLLATGRDLIGAFYTQRYPFDGVHFKAAAAMMGPGGQRGDLPPFNWGDIIPVHFLPMGATLISRRCMEAVLAKFPRPFEWQIDIDRPAGGLCVPPGEEVFWGPPIEAVQLGAHLLDATGQYSTVLSKHERIYHGRLITIRPRGILIPFRVTEEHNILVGQRLLNGMVEERWCPAGQIKADTRTYIAFPIPRAGPLRREIDLATFVPWDKQTEALLVRTLLVTEALLEWCGLYLAEGSAHEGDIRLSFGVSDKESALAQRASELAAAAFCSQAPRVIRGDHSWQTVWKRRALGRVLHAWFGSSARVKHVPFWIRDLPAEQVIPFLRGVFLGDGYLEQVHQAVGLNLASKQAILDVAALLIGLGIRPSVIPHKAAKGAFNAGTQMYRLMVFTDAPKLAALLGLPWSPKPHGRYKRQPFFANGKLWLEVGSVKTEDYEGPVHDLTLRPSNSYVLGMSIVHNSEDFDYCAKAASVGYIPYLHTGLVCGHETTAHATPGGLVVPGP